MITSVPGRHATISSEIISFLRPWVPRGICEIGAGFGIWLAALNEAGVDAIGYDICPRGSNVLLGDHIVASQHKDRAMLAVWPPDGREIATWIRAWRGDTIIICGVFSRMIFEGALNDFIERDFMTLPAGRKGPSTLAVYTRK